MNVKQFVAQVEEALHDFEIYWMRNHQASTDEFLYPLELTMAEWQEQFGFYLDDTEL